MKKLFIVLVAATATVAIQLPAAAQAVITTKKDGKPAPSQYTPVNSKPDFDYLKNYLKNPQVLGSKKVNLTGSINRVKKAEKAKLAGKGTRAKTLLLKTVEHVHKLSEKGKLQPLYAQHYQQAVDTLITSWSPPVPRVNGGYPDAWHNAPMGSIVDSWGMYNRQAVSYAAFRVYDSGRNMPYWGGRGNANQWDDNARAAGIPVDATPQVGDIAILNVGLYGHAAYVEEVMPNGSVRVSQYNQSNDGLYSESIIAASATNVVYIHFPYNESD